jgi:hypothetical protein
MSSLGKYAHIYSDNETKMDELLIAVKNIYSPHILCLTELPEILQVNLNNYLELASLGKNLMHSGVSLSETV